MITLMLKYKGLWTIVDRSLPAPALTDTQGHLKWTQHDQEAQLQIMTSLNSSPLNHVLDARTVKEVWDLLRVRYQGDDDLWQHYLLECLFTTTFRNLDPMEPQITDIMAIAHQLTDIGFPISDQLLAGAIRVKLPESWDTLKTVLANTTGGTQTSKGIISQVLAEEHHHVHAAGGDATAYYAKGAVKGKKKGKRCSHCKNKGHIASKCCKCEPEESASSNTSTGKTSGKSRSGKSSSAKSSSRGTTPKPPSSWATDSAKIVTADSDSRSSSSSDDTIGAYMAHFSADEDVEHVYKTKAELCESNLRHGWLINSGTSQTMCSHHTWFSNFTPLSQHTKVILGDNSAIPAVGSSRLNIKMLANGKWIDSVLQDVLYMPDLHGNLLSVSHLVWRSTKVLFSGEACQVFDRRKSLILEEGLCNNLYIMNMHIADYITANIASLSPQLMDADQPITRALTTWLTSLSVPLALWHRCLGHLNFRSVKRMVDEGLITSMTISDRNTPSDPCELCLEGKQTHDVIHKVATTRAEHVLGCMHTNVCCYVLTLPLLFPPHHPILTLPLIPGIHPHLPPLLFLSSPMLFPLILLISFHVLPQNPSA
jgi:hypothetical protein